MRRCPDCNGLLIIKDYNPIDARYAPADYCVECDEFYDYEEGYETPKAWKKVFVWGVIIVISSIALKFIF